MIQSDHLVPLVLALVVLFGAVPIAWATIAAIHRKRTGWLINDEKGGIHIPQIGGLLSLKGQSWFILAFNYWRPLLLLSPGGFEYRMLRRHRREYSAISLVDYARTVIGTRNVIVEFKESPFSYIAQVPADDIARNAILAFQSKGCLLAPRALELVSAD